VLTQYLSLDPLQTRIDTHERYSEHATLAGVPGVTAHLADAQALPFPEASFDAVTARHMLYHVPDPVLAIR